MNDFIPAPQQAAAIREIVDWYRTPHNRKQVFRLFGYAGSGKTTITQHAIRALGLNPMNRQGGGGGVLFAAFTGKAALVMTRKGTPASTIVYDDGLSRTAEDRARWLYTAITRAERGLVILD